MKKILLTTTALVALAGAASADVSLSGSAEIGLVSGDRYGVGTDAMFHSDLDVKFTLSGETDNGLTFGATIDLDELNDATGPADDGIDAVPGAGGDFDGETEEHSVFISGGFGTVTMGDTDGAFDWAMQEVGIGSSIADDHTSHLGYNGNSGLDGTYDGQILRYDHTFGDFGVALSAELDDTVGGGDTAWGLGVKYNAALGGVDLGLGLALQDAGTTDIWGVSVDAKFGGGFRAILNYSDRDVAGVSTTHTGIGLGYSTGAFGVSANWGEFDTAGVTTDGYALQADYDLGGGAQVQFGYASDLGAIGADSWSLGLAMSF